MFDGYVSSYLLCYNMIFTEINAYRHFPTFKGEDGTIKREVLIPMVALVATAVSVTTLYITRY